MLPILQFRQKPALIGIEAGLGDYSIRQPRASLSISTKPGEFDMQHTDPQLTIDQSQAWAAYTGGSPLEMNQRIYSGVREIFLQGIANRVQQGNRVAAIHQPGNSIAEVYGTDTEAHILPEFRGPASIDNVDIHFSITPIRIDYKDRTTDIIAQVNPPEVEYRRGKLNIYMRQYQSIEFLPPELDAQI